MPINIFPIPHHCVIRKAQTHISFPYFLIQFIQYVSHYLMTIKLQVELIRYPVTYPRTI